MAMRTNLKSFIVIILGLFLVSVVACGDDDGDENVGETNDNIITDTGNTGGTADTGDTSDTSDWEETDGTSSGDTETEEPLPTELDYSDMALWMCTPGAADNPCEVPLTATEVLPDNTFGEETTSQANPDAAFDCFYVYPTTDLSSTAGNHMDLTDNEAFRAVATGQTALFSSLCHVYAPYYRQMTIGAYYSPDYQDFFDFAYSDVISAFEYYMENFNNGRDLVLISHSQGSHMMTQLLKDKFDSDSAMRDKLISALLIGTADVFIPTGSVVGGTFDNLPLCTSDGQTGCIVAYNTLSAPTNSLTVGVLKPAEGQDVACVNPAALGGGAAYLKAHVGPAGETTLPQGLTTNAGTYKDFYKGECVGGDDLVSGLVVKAEPLDANDQRVNPIDFEAVAAIMVTSSYSLHTMDYTLTNGTLVELVRAQSESR